MSYMELNDVLYRGRLEAANGVMRLQMTGSNVAVDTLNVVQGAVTFSYLFRTGYKRMNTTMDEQVAGYFTVHDAKVCMEFTTRVTGSGTLFLSVDGQHQPERVDSATVNDPVTDYRRLVYLSGGTHRVGIAGTFGSIVQQAVIRVRYIRPTGGNP